MSAKPSRAGSRGREFIGTKETTFESAREFAAWLKKHHASADEVVAVLTKKGSGRVGMTYPEALDEALSFGWIDGVRRARDRSTYTIRFCPRRRGSIWSHVNVAHAERLIRDGRMQAAGRKAFEARAPARTGVYSFENRPHSLPPELEDEFRARTGAWTFFNQQPPGYRRTILWWVVSAKQPETRRRRLAAVMKTSGAGKRVDLLKPFG